MGEREKACQYFISVLEFEAKQDFSAFHNQ